MNELLEESYTPVRFIRNYEPGTFDGLRSVRKGEVIDVKVWLARALMELGYIIWKRGTHK